MLSPPQMSPLLIPFPQMSPLLIPFPQMSPLLIPFPQMNKPHIRGVNLGITIDLFSLGLVAKSSVYELFNVTLQRVVASMQQTPVDQTLSATIQVEKRLECKLFY